MLRVSCSNVSRLKMMILILSFIISVIFAAPLTKECRDDVQGLDYEGTLDKTRTGQRCLAWEESQTILTATGWVPKWKKTPPKNFCRNPDEHAEGPWCFVEGARPDSRVVDFCEVPFCATPMTTMRTTTTTPTTTETTFPIPDYIRTFCHKDLSVYRHPDITDKTRYYICLWPGTVHERIVPKKCPPNTRFDQFKKVCVHDGSTEHVFNKICISGNETFAHPENCSMYLQCMGMRSAPIERPCPDGTVVSKLGICQFEDHENVEDRCKGILSRKETGTSNDRKGDQSTDKADVDEEANENQSDQIADGDVGEDGEAKEDEEAGEAKEDEEAGEAKVDVEARAATKDGKARVCGGAADRTFREFSARNEEKKEERKENETEADEEREERKEDEKEVEEEREVKKEKAEEEREERKEDELEVEEEREERKEDEKEVEEDRDFMDDEHDYEFHESFHDFDDADPGDHDWIDKIIKRSEEEGRKEEERKEREDDVFLGDRNAFDLFVKSDAILDSFENEGGSIVDDSDWSNEIGRKRMEEEEEDGEREEKERILKDLINGQSDLS